MTMPANSVENDTDGGVVLDEINRSLPLIADAMASATKDVVLEQLRIVNRLVQVTDPQRGARGYTANDVAADVLRFPLVLLNGAARVAAAMSYRSDPPAMGGSVPVAFFAVPANKKSASAQTVRAKQPVKPGKFKVSVSGPGTGIKPGNISVTADGSSEVEIALQELSGRLKVGNQYMAYVWWDTPGVDKQAIAQVIIVIEDPERRPTPRR